MGKKEKKSHDILGTMVASGIAGVIIIVLMGVIMYQFIKGDEDPKEAGNKTGSETVSTEVTGDDGKAEWAKITATIQALDLVQQRVTVLDVATQESIVLHMTKSIGIKDKYGTPMTLKELNVGDVIFTKYNKINNQPREFRLSSEAWEYTTKGIVINTENKTVSRGNEVYKYTKDLISLSAGQPFDIKKLTAIDQVRIRGYKDNLMSLELISGHGTVKLTNYMTFIGATMDIDINKSYVIEEDMEPIMVEEGMHRVVIKQEGYEPYIKEIVVLPNEPYEISLAEFQPKQGEVEFVINLEDVKVYVGDQLVEDISEPVLLKYGKYNVRIIKDDIIISEEELEVNRTYIRYSKEIEKPDTTRGIHISTDPAGVELFIDNQFKGYTPITIRLEPGEYKAMLIKEGYNMVEYPISIIEGKEDQTFTFPPMVQKGQEPTNNNDTGVSNPTPPAPEPPTVDPSTPNTGDEGNDPGITTPGEDVYSGN